MNMGELNSNSKYNPRPIAYKVLRGKTEKKTEMSIKRP